MPDVSPRAGLPVFRALRPRQYACRLAFVFSNPPLLVEP